jgi:hypothetical protein
VLTHLLEPVMEDAPFLGNDPLVLAQPVEREARVEQER